MKLYVEEMYSILPDIKDCTHDQLRFIIAKYGTFVELLSFWSVMGYAYYRVKSPAGKEALIDNIECEGKDSHQSMLNTFLSECNAFPTIQVQEIMREALKPSRKVLQESSQKNSAFAHIAILTFAENTSLAFIQWLAKAAKEVGCKDFTYTAVHGEADIKHAQLFEKAFYDEKTYSGASDEDVDELKNIYFALMKIIFSV